MKQYLLAPILAALAMFLWGFLYYAAIGVQYGALQTIDKDVGPALNELFPTSGVYVIPDPRGDSEERTKLGERGPIAMVHLRREGMESMTKTLIGGFVLEFVCCVLFAGLLRRSRMHTFGGRVLFMVVAGCIATLWARGGDAIWWQQDWSWHRMTMLYDVLAWLFAGLVLAALVKPPLLNSTE